jgi:hypothetical protein
MLDLGFPIAQPATSKSMESSASFARNFVPNGTVPIISSWPGDPEKPDVYAEVGVASVSNGRQHRIGSVERICNLAATGR